MTLLRKLTLALTLAFTAGYLLAGALVPHADPADRAACHTILVEEPTLTCTGQGTDGHAVVMFPRTGPCATCTDARYYAEQAASMG